MIRRGNIGVNIKVLATGAGMCGISLLRTCRRRYNSLVVMTQSRSFNIFPCGLFRAVLVLKEHAATISTTPIGNVARLGASRVMRFVRRQLMEHGRVGRIFYCEHNLRIPACEMISGLPQLSMLWSLTRKDLSRVDQIALAIFPGDGVIGFYGDIRSVEFN